jgi:hypothetical protein
MALVITLWRRMRYFLLGSGIFLALLAGLLAITRGALDLYILDRYFLVLPGRLLLVSAFLVLIALAVWNGKISH